MRSRIAVALSAGAVLVLALTSCAGGGTPDSSPEDEEATSFTMAISPWIGYGLWYIAEQEGYFGDLDVELESYTDYNGELAAISSGAVDGVSFAVNSTIQNYDALPVTAVLMLDSSTTADAILSTSEISSVSDLAGKKIAYDYGTTSELLLSAALLNNGMTFDDIEMVVSPPEQAAGLLVAGSVDAAITYEPYISAVTGEAGIEVLHTAEDEGALISDMLYVNRDYLAANPGVIDILVEAWDKAAAFYEANPEEGQEIIADAIGADVESLRSAFAGVKFYNLQENVEIMGETFGADTLPLIVEAMLQGGMLEEAPDLSQAYDASSVLRVAGE
ncbi:ABC transporter substrate-binding protein [Microbacterium enclense]|uniref:ABC transporter substrate-binding protein n=1 Tax=Microbacterium enclense TaxID=993073 RepID=UPI0021A41799|nr:ABC transporter substrate-binding protein [Microbacterium enclense]MCT2085160.1 ABC transporter substrate-binding protein [Microbacterium enclense]